MWSFDDLHQEEATVRTRRLLWLGALLRLAATGYPRGPCRESWRTRDNVGRGGMENNGGFASRGALDL